MGWGRGLGGVEPSINPTIPPSLPGAPPPLGYEGGRSALPGKEGGMVGLMDDF